MNIFIKTIYLLSLLLFCECYKILVVFPYPVRSLNILGEGFVKHLLNAGHEVTYITVYPLKNQMERLQQINVTSNLKLVDGMEMLTISQVMDNEVPQADIKVLQEFAVITARMTFEHENVQAFLKDKTRHFDVVLTDLYESEIYAALGALYDCPMIWCYSMGAHWLVLRLIDEATNPAYTTDYLSSNTLPLSFVERAEELFAQLKWTYYKEMFTKPSEEKLYIDTFEPLFEERGKALPAYKDLIYNASLIFGNDHHAFGNVPKLPLNFRLIGGQHISEHATPLPKDLQNIMDNAKHGVIYFSMGSTWKSKDIPKSVTKALLKMFGELKETVIWKYEEDLKNIPANVHIVHWAPQPGILAHPNCLMFISHGGQLSSTEAVHFGVPVIGVPIYFDQFLNIQRAVTHGYAVQVRLSYDLPNHLMSAIKTVLLDKSFSKRAKELSAIYHHRPVHPGAELVHWVEHVVRTRGARHLRSPSRTIPWYQKQYLDLIAFLAAILFTFIKAIQSFIFKINRKLNEKKKRN